MNQLQIEQLRPLVEAETGMDFSGNRFSRLCDAVQKVVNHSGDETIVDRLLANPSDCGPFLERLTAELTVGETFFFRNDHHFRAMREQVIPGILAANSDRKEFRIWSAGCATGEEPYSLAILMDQLTRENPGVQDAQVSILATDIDPEFLRRARKAEYRDWSFRRTDIHKHPDYFSDEGDKYCLASAMRERVRFAYLNLVKDVYPSPLSGTVGLDLILFRNVAIYLYPDVVAAIVQRFHRCLRPGGWLLLGEAEVPQVQPVGYEVRRIGQATFFQKPLTTKPSAIQPDNSPRPVLRSAYRNDRSTSACIPASTPIQKSALPDECPIEKSDPEVSSTSNDTQAFDWEHIEQFLLRENYDLAESEFDLIPDRSQRATIKLKFARRLLDLAQTTRAREALDSCLELDPLLIDAYLMKASLADERGQLAEAESACRRAIYLDHKCVMAHFQLALIQQQGGDSNGARKSFQLVQKLAETHDPNALIAHGDGVCYGRVCEMAQSMMGI